MEVVPVETVLTTPPDIVATPVLLLPHVPPPVASESVTDKPIHTVLLPDIASGSGFTVTTAVVLHVVGNV